MSGVVLNHYGQALVFDRVTGECRPHAVPTAIENVARGGGRFVHGDSGERMEAPEEPAPEPDPVIQLKQEELLDLPADPAPEAAPAVAADFAKFDRDGDGHPGGSIPGPRPRPRRAAKK